MSTRDRLLKLLRDFQGADASGTHIEAEELLLKLLDDKEVTEAWEDAMDLWWYA